MQIDKLARSELRLWRVWALVVVLLNVVCCGAGSEPAEVPNTLVGVQSIGPVTARAIDNSGSVDARTGVVVSPTGALVAGAWGAANGIIVVSTVSRSSAGEYIHSVARLDATDRHKVGLSCELTRTTAMAFVPTNDSMASRVRGTAENLITTTVKERVWQVRMSDTTCTDLASWGEHTDSGNVQPVTHLDSFAGATEQKYVFATDIGTSTWEGSAATDHEWVLNSKVAFSLEADSNAWGYGIRACTIDARGIHLAYSVSDNAFNRYAGVALFDFGSASPKWSQAVLWMREDAEDDTRGACPSGIAVHGTTSCVVGTRSRGGDTAAEIIATVTHESAASSSSRWDAHAPLQPWEPNSNTITSSPFAPPAVVAVPGGFLVAEAYSSRADSAKEWGMMRLSWLDMGGHRLLTRVFDLPPAASAAVTGPKGGAAWWVGGTIPLVSEPFVHAGHILIPFGEHLVIADRWGNLTATASAACSEVKGCKAEDESCSFATCLGDGKCTIIQAKDGESCPGGSCSDGKCVKTVP